MKGVSYRPDIQGLRAIAVLAVIVFHFNPALLPGGFVGVDIFLVISGFLISSILFNKKDQSNYQPIATLKYFYLSRFKRLVPSYFAVLVVVSLLAAVLFLPADFATYRDGLKKAVYFNSNNYFANFGDYFAPANYEQPLLHTWSLAVEVQFYLIAPFIFLFLPKRILIWLLPVSVIALTAYAEYQLRISAQEQATYYSLAARLPAFFIGGWVALLMKNRNSKHIEIDFKKYLVWLAAALIFLSLWLPKVTSYFPGIAGLIPVVGAALLIVNTASSPVSRLLSSKVLVWVGSLSYSLYLWHWPVIALIRYYTGVEILSWQYSLAFIISTLIFATASYYWIETPLRLKLSKKQAIGYASLGIAVLLTGWSIKKINVFYTPELLPVEFTRYADPKTICHGQIVGDCLKGDLTSDREVLVLGDSHAAMLNPFFDYLGKELKFRAKIITASSCLTIEGFDLAYIAEWARKNCTAQIMEATSYIKNSDYILLAGMWSYQLVSDINIKAILSFLDAHPDKKIGVLTQIPELLVSPQRLARFKRLGLNKEQGFTTNWYHYDFLIKDMLSACDHCKLLSNDIFKAVKTLPYKDNSLLYFDKSHLNESGSVRYADTMKNQIQSWLVIDNDE